MLRLRTICILAIVSIAVASQALANRVCEKCGEPILSGYEISWQGKFYHNLCLKCEYCGEPLEPIAKGGMIQGDKYYHATCFYRYVKLRCYVCGEWIEGAYHRDPWGNCYHKHHEDEHPRCEYCWRFITQEVTGGGIYYADGRTICHLCLPSAIADQDSARSILEEVGDTLGGIGVKIDLSDVRIRLLSKDTMEKRFGSKRANANGICMPDEDLMTGERVYKIYLLFGMPRLHFVKVVAHELMHVWLYQNQDAEIQQEYDRHKHFIEGSCNMAAYLALKRYESDEVVNIIDMVQRNRDPHYGSGFREAKQFVDAHSVEDWLELIKTDSRFPPVSGD